MQTTKCFSPIGESKEEWKVFRALSDNFDKELQFNNLSELRNEIVSFFDVFKQLYSLPSLNSKLSFGMSEKIEERLFEYNK